MTAVGYVWVGPLEHSSEYQRDLLKQVGVTRIYADISPNSVTQARPGLTAALDEIGADDTLVIWRLDRLAATLPHVLSLLELLGNRGVGVRSLTEKIDTAGPDGKTILTVVHAFTELERTLTRERTMVGVYAARARGRVGGRPRALSATNIERVAMLRDQGASVREIAEQLGTSRATIYRAIEEQNQIDAESEAQKKPPHAIRFVAPSLTEPDAQPLGEG